MSTVEMKNDETISDEKIAAEEVARREALERQAKENPRGYRTRVLVWAAAGYLFLWLCLLLFVGLTVLLIVSFVSVKGAPAVRVKLLLVLGVVEYQLLRSLWWRPKPPPGILLGAEEYPKLRAEVERLRERLGAPPVHAIVIDSSPNMAILQNPRLGMFGWHKNYLIIGFPYLRLLTIEEWRAIVAHEMGHLSGEHGKTMAWIYRTRRTWYEFIHRRQSGKGVFGRLFDFYVTRFERLSFLLARMQEYEADRRSAEVTSPAAVSSALIRTGFIDAGLTQVFWPKIWGRTRVAATPETQRPFRELRPETVLSVLSPDQESLSLRRALEAPTSWEDTHPSLTERLAALGVAGNVPSPQGENAAEALLTGAEQERIAGLLDQSWSRESSPEWKEAHEKASLRRARLEDLERRVRAGETLSGEDEEERVALVYEWNGPEAALPLAVQAHARRPGSVAAAFQLARIRLDLGDPECVPLLLHVAQADYTAAPSVHELAAPFLLRHGFIAEEATLRERVSAFARDYEQAVVERQSIDVSSTLVAHEWSSEAIEHLRERIGCLGIIKRAWLLEKKMHFLPGWHPLFLVAVELTGGYTLQNFGVNNAAEEATKLLLQLGLPGNLCFYVVRGESEPLSRMIYPFAPFFRLTDS